MEMKANILVIDDEEDLRENLKYVLLMQGYDVQLAEDGVQGLKKLETYTPDLIILDLNMPNMGGIEFYQRICDKDIPRFPVFVLTARANMEQFFKDFNVDGFMAKPFEIPDLISEVKTIINKRVKKATPVAQESSSKNVFIVDNDQAFLARVGTAFLMKGFTVNVASTGTEAIERITRKVPDVACIRMNLSDLAGEVVISKLKRMAKTSDVRCILFASGIAEREVITDKIQHKVGVEKFVVVTSEQDLVDAVREL
ncbi:MAG: response regulator [Candidatus Omnitrophica bacterium]|nr:response regulator [Candidatus Omnitrophota bacterium]